MKPSCQLALRLLQENESVTTHDLLVGGVGSRCSARIHELRHDHGYVITEERLKGERSGSRYRLIAEPELPKPSGERPTGYGRRRDDPCKGVVMAQPARDSSASAHGLSAAGVDRAIVPEIGPAAPGLDGGPASLGAGQVVERVSAGAVDLDTRHDALGGTDAGAGADSLSYLFDPDAYGRAA